jgi:hypothetical protein
MGKTVLNKTLPAMGAAILTVLIHVISTPLTSQGLERDSVMSRPTAAEHVTVAVIVVTAMHNRHSTINAAGWSKVKTRH